MGDELLDPSVERLPRNPVTGKVRFIEMKGRAGTAPVALTANEHDRASPAAWEGALDE